MGHTKRSAISLAATSTIWPNGNLSSRVQFWTLAARMANYDAIKLARHFEINVRQLERYFRAEMGRSPQNWLNEQRMIAARWLLIESKSVKRVAIELGYNHIPYFCRQFRQYYGMSPSEFLRCRADLNADCR